MAAPRRRWYHGFGLGGRSLFDLFDAHNEPVLISRGTFPYRRVVLGVRPGLASIFAAEMSVDLARALNCSLKAVGVAPSELVTGNGYQEMLRRCLDEVVELGHVYGVEVDAQLHHGNPVHFLEEISKDCDLLVVAHRRNRRTAIIRPDVSRHLILRAHCSTLCLSHNLPSADDGTVS